MRQYLSFLFISAVLSFYSCDTSEGSNLLDQEVSVKSLRIKVDVNAIQARLDDMAQESSMADTNFGVAPKVELIGIHSIELVADENVKVGKGEMLYKGAEVSAGGANAIDFRETLTMAPGEYILEVPLSQVPNGTYEWIRLGVCFQRFTVTKYNKGNPLTATFAAFTDFNTYLEELTIRTQDVIVYDDKKQGYFAYENVSNFKEEGFATTVTVPNPLSAKAPLPENSGIHTARFDEPLVIDRVNNKDIELTLSLSTNKSFEWNDKNRNQRWDWDIDEKVVDFGFRSMVATKN